jgi:hypothetical protein
MIEKSARAVADDVSASYPRAHASLPSCLRRCRGEISTEQDCSVTRQLELSHLQFRALATDPHRVLAPMELEGLARRDISGANVPKKWFPFACNSTPRLRQVGANILSRAWVSFADHTVIHDYYADFLRKTFL